MNFVKIALILMSLIAVSCGTPSSRNSGGPRVIERKVQYDARSMPEGPADSRCVERALRFLRERDPAGARNYDLLEQKKLFTAFLDCDRLAPSLPAAVHESTHALSTQTGSYVLQDGSRLKIIEDDAGFMPPREIIPFVDMNGMYAQTYLRGTASAKDYFHILLDEMNAYTRDLFTATKLAHLREKNVTSSNRDGLLAMMNFVRVYAETARSRSPRTAAALRAPDRARILHVLWAQAELALAESCPHPALGLEDAAGFAAVYRGPSTELAGILGRALRVPAPCARFLAP